MFGRLRRWLRVDAHGLAPAVDVWAPGRLVWTRPPPSVEELECRFARLEAEQLGDRQAALAWRVAQLEDAARSHGWELGSRDET